MDLLMNLHCIGDSHSSFFLGQNRISAEYPKFENGIFKNIYCYRLGSSLAFNLNKNNTNTKAREKVFLIIEKLDNRKDIILLSFGEVDCRAHLLKNALAQKITNEEVVQKCIKNYLVLIKELIDLKFKVILWNAVYSAQFNEFDNFEYPYYGTLVERNVLTKLFNTYLSNHAFIGYIFLESVELLNNDSFITKDVYFFDAIHLNNKLFLKTINQICHLIPEFKPVVNLKEIITFTKLYLFNIAQAIKVSFNNW